MSLEQPPAEMVQELLLSDDYWQAPIPLFHKNKWRDVTLPVTEHDRYVYDPSLTYDIGSLVVSAQKDRSITLIEDGSDLPVLHPRQFLKLIVDECSPALKYRLGYLRDQRRARQFERYAQQTVPGYKSATFEENLAKMYATDLPVSGSAEVMDFYRGVGRIAQRKVSYARPYEATGQFAAMGASFVDLKGIWASIPLEPVPHVKVGELYSCRSRSSLFRRARIVSAQIVEVTTDVDWKIPPSEGGTNKKGQKQARRF